MISLKEYIVEQRGYGLTIFDIGDTLFHTFAEIKVMKDGKVLHSLTNQEFNVYELKDGESFDFGEFRDAKHFRATSKPIEKMINKAKAIIKNVVAKGSDAIILTARADFDDKDEFLQKFRDHGFPIDHVYVERAGNLKAPNSAIAKVKVIEKYLAKRGYARVRLFDDAKSNLEALLGMKKDYPNIDFQAYLVDHSGNITKFK